MIICIFLHSASCSNSCKACSTSSLANLNLSKLNSDIAFSNLLFASICIWILSYEITLLTFGSGALNTDCFIFYYIGFGGGGGACCCSGFFYGWFLSYFIISINLFFANTLRLSCCSFNPWYCLTTSYSLWMVRKSYK